MQRPPSTWQPRGASPPPGLGSRSASLPHWRPACRACWFFFPAWLRLFASSRVVRVTPLKVNFSSEDKQAVDYSTRPSAIHCRVFSPSPLRSPLLPILLQFLLVYLCVVVIVVVGWSRGLCVQRRNPSSVRTRCSGAVYANLLFHLWSRAERGAADTHQPTHQPLYVVCGVYNASLRHLRKLSRLSQLSNHRLSTRRIKHTSKSSPTLNKFDIEQANQHTIRSSSAPQQHVRGNERTACPYFSTSVSVYQSKYGNLVAYCYCMRSNPT